MTVSTPEENAFEVRESERMLEFRRQVREIDRLVVSQLFAETVHSGQLSASPREDQTDTDSDDTDSDIPQ